MGGTDSVVDRLWSSGAVDRVPTEFALSAIGASVSLEVSCVFLELSGDTGGGGGDACPSCSFGPVLLEDC